MSPKAEQTSWLSRTRPMIWLKDLYHWVMGWAEHPSGTLGLCFVAAIESIFFPIPADPLLVAMGAAKPKKALWFAFLTTAFSVAGGLLGYALGYLFWDATQEIFFTYVFNAQKFDLVMGKFQNNAFLSIFVAGFTPIPFKVFTVAAGVANLNILSFFVGAFIGRGMRFFIIGLLLYKFGPQIRGWLEKNFERITVALGIVVVLGLVVYNVTL